jgi:ABC-type multidrug transport system ATPase subunit
MDKIYLLSKQYQKVLLNKVSLDFQRTLMQTIKRNARLIGLIGERGVGKTTMMLQRLKETGE